MLPDCDPRIAAFDAFVKETNLLRGKLDRAHHDFVMVEADQKTVDTSKDRNEVRPAKERLAKAEPLEELATRYWSARLSFELHVTKGMKIKGAALDAAEEFVLRAVGGKACLTTCPVGPFALPHLYEIRTARRWPQGKPSPRDTNLHISEVWKVVDRTVSEVGSLARQKTHPSQWMVDLFDDLLAFHGSQEVMSAALLKQGEDAYAHLPLGYDPAKANSPSQSHSI